MAPSELLLLRHGETDWNREQRCQGHDDRSELNDAGRRQAHDVVEAVRAFGPDLIVSSDLTRALETADIVAGTLGVARVTDPLLRERSFGALEGGPLRYLTVDVTGIDGGVVVNPDTRPAGGESLRDLALRARRFLEKVDLAWPERRLLVVTHGGLIRALRWVVAGHPLEQSEWYPVDNCSTWTLTPTA